MLRNKAMRKILLMLMVGAGLVAGTGCTQYQVEFWRGMTPHQQETVVNYLEEQGKTGNATWGCHEAVDELWPASSRDWAHRIVNRESGGDPSAQNPTSSAAGCFQILQMHAWRFESLGYSWAARYNAYINTQVALQLYNESGTSPWGGY